MSDKDWRIYKKRRDRALEAGRPEPDIDDWFKAQEPTSKNVVPPHLRPLVQFTRKAITFEELCNRLGKTPGEARRMIAEAKGRGINIQLGVECIQLSPEEQVRSVQDTRIMPTGGERQQVGVISDLHLGSKYCLRAQLQDCVWHFYERGIRNILVPGDLVDGCYPFARFELTHVGLEDQTQDLYETLPHMPGLNYHAITGNHDCTYHTAIGVNVGKFISNYFQIHGRDDLRFYGDCGAFIEIQGAVIEMWHPMGGVAYAKSYKLQRHVQAYGAGQKPHICLAGHLHQFAVVEERGVFAVMCPCFQASGSAFAKRIGIQPELGGLILSWEIAGVDLVRNFAVERRRYFEMEQPTRVEEI
jgi:UDP-2,3-diacylglucosamine pyrophosphatase LpxH